MRRPWLSKYVRIITSPSRPVEKSMIQHGPLMIAGGLLLLAGIMLFSTGLLGEVMIRTYFESQGRRIYAVREIRSRREAVRKE